MQATKYKLYYFDGPGRGELPRILFAAAGQPFEDVRIRNEDWPTYKPKMPFGQVPVLEVDGTMISQEYAISKFLAKEFGFCSESNLDQAREDMYVLTAEDIYRRLVPIYYKRIENLNADELTQKFAEEVGPNILSKLNEHLEANKSGFFVGDRMTHADLTMFHTLSGMVDLAPKESVELLTAYPNLKRHMDLVSSHPNMVIYLQKRAEAEKESQK